MMEEICNIKDCPTENGQAATKCKFDDCPLENKEQPEPEEIVLFLMKKAFNRKDD